MTAKRFTLKGLIEGVPNICDNGKIIEQEEAVMLLNKLNDENDQLKKENNQLHQKIFEQRTKEALDRTEISNQTYIRNKTSKEYLTVTEFLNEMEKW